LPSVDDCPQTTPFTPFRGWLAWLGISGCFASERAHHPQERRKGMRNGRKAGSGALCVKCCDIYVILGLHRPFVEVKKFL